jgi:PHD/YefM family antitoxin component YafN of YafNO toxin-antitoxin module
MLIGVEDDESVEATLELLLDPEAQARVRRSERDIAAGRILDAEALRIAMERARGKRR